MRQFHWTICAAALTLACGGEAVAPISGLPRELTLSERTLVSSGNRFAFDFFREVVAHSEPGENVFVSPLSAAMALGMTWNGARGETREAMAQALRLENLPIEEASQSFRSLIDLLRDLDPLVDFRLANSIWYGEGRITPRAEFLDINQQYFDAEVSALDFASPDAVATINGWVEGNTGGRIPRIIEQMDSRLVMLLINAIYFKATWVYEFEKDRTRDEPFTLRDGSTRPVPLMRHAAPAPVGYYAGAGFEVVDLPYGAGAYSMTIILPEPGRPVDEVIAGLNADGWDAILAGLETQSMPVALPKFRIEYDKQLKEVLTALGMGIAFQPGQADLSGIGGDPGGLYIDFVKQGTFVEVNEEGTEAAAATAVGIGIVCDCGPREFLVDQPFVFAIRERFSGTILFAGRVMDPAEN
jgi:serpin B